MIIKKGISESKLTAKSIKQIAKKEAKKLIDNARIQAMNLEASLMESAKDKIDNALEEGKNLIESKIKEETGYTIQEARYHAISAYKKAKESIDNAPLEIKGLENSMKVKASETFEEIKKKMSDELYNAFFLNEILEAIDKAKVVVAQTRDLGEKAIDDVVTHMKYIQENFKLGNDLVNPKKFSLPGKEEDESDVDNPKEEETQAGEKEKTPEVSYSSSLMEELVKTKASTSGKDYDYTDKKKTAKIAKTALGMLSTVLPVMIVLKKLIENWRTNKLGLRDDSAERLADLFENQSQGEIIPAKDVFDQLISTTRKVDDSNEDSSINNLVNNTDISNISILADSSNAYVTEESKSCSELDRIYSAIASSIKECRYDENYPLMNMSTQKSGGKVKNLKHAGNSKEELIDAIESLDDMVNEEQKEETKSIETDKESKNISKKRGWLNFGIKMKSISEL